MKPERFTSPRVMETAHPLAQVARRSLSLGNDELRAECEERFFIASGPGGQHRNKTETAVRLVHRPTGITVNATDSRSQSFNREQALERLRLALQKMSFVPKPRKATKPSKSSKRRRLEGKRINSEKKQNRRGFDE